MFDPAIAGGERHDLGLADHGHGGEVKGIEHLANRQAGLGEMAFDAPPPAIGDLEFRERGEEAGRGPAYIVRLFREFGP